MPADAAVSIGVVSARSSMLNAGRRVTDPIINILIVILTIIGTWGLFRDSFNLSIGAVPGHINLESVSH